MAEAVLTTSLMRALSLFRWATLFGAWVGVVLSHRYLIHPVAAIALLTAASALTAGLHWAGRHRPELTVRTSVLVAEVSLGVVLLLADGWVYEPDRPQSLPWSWPAAGIAAVGIARGGQLALLVAVLIGAASLTTEVVLLDRFTGTAQLPMALSKVGLWLLVGGIAGPLTDRLRRAEAMISVARAREEVARQLHDGVLQTLAVVQRRSDDGDLVAMAREQEQSLRLYLSDDRLAPVGDTPDSGPLGEQPTEIEPALRAAAADAERRHGLAVSIVVAADCGRPPATTVEALAGAVGELLTNAAKHGAAGRATVYAEPADNLDRGADSVVVSVKDDGVGFDPDTMVEGIGWSRSVRGRIEEAGGRVELTSRPGRGTEVRVWV